MMGQVQKLMAEIVPQSGLIGCHCRQINMTAPAIEIIPKYKNVMKLWLSANSNSGNKPSTANDDDNKVNNTNLIEDTTIEETPKKKKNT